MAVAKAVLLEPFAEQEQKITQKALVVGGGVAGMWRPRHWRLKYPVCLVEKSSRWADTQASCTRPGAAVPYPLSLMNW